MTRISRRLAIVPVIASLALLTSLAAFHLGVFNSGHSNLKMVVDSLSVPDNSATYLYSGNEDVPEKQVGNALSYHRRDGKWVFEDVKSVALERRDNQFATYKDGSLEFFTRGADGITNVSRQTYFPLPVGQDELAGRHPELSEQYSDDGKTVTSSTLRWYSGNIHETTSLDADGCRHVVGYADDGETVLSERIFNKPEHPWLPTDLKMEKHWLANASHSLVYDDEQNTDGTRTIVAFDENGYKLWQANWAKGDIVHGTTVDGFYPGTHNLHFHSESRSQSDYVDYFRLNGTHLAHLEINCSVLSIDFFDDSGVNLHLSQTFERADAPDFNLDHSTYSLGRVVEYDAAGKMSREFSLYHGQTHMFERTNDTVRGVAYPRVAYFINDDNKVTAISYWTNAANVDGVPDFVERDLHETLALPGVPADEQRLHFKFGDDMLPVPPPQRNSYGN